ncbi:MAG: NAD(P)-dependent oxidoreductase [Candidatus Helarchaeota archaeon]
MKIAVFGATGGLGQQFLKKALAKGHEIIAYVRSPKKITYSNDNLTVIEGDVFDKEKIIDSLRGTDAVLITWRMRSQKIPLFSEGTQNVIDAMKKNNVKRIIVISEYAYGEHYRNFGFIVRNFIKLYGTFAKFQQNERKQQDSIVRNSGLEWTIDRIRGLNNKESDEQLELTLEPKSKFKTIFRGTAAEKILHQFENPGDYLQKDIYF